MLKIFTFKLTRFGQRITKLENAGGEKESFDKLMKSKRELHNLKTMI